MGRRTASGTDEAVAEAAVVVVVAGVVVMVTEAVTVAVVGISARRSSTMATSKSHVPNVTTRC